MATRATSVWLPRAGVLVCLRPGKDLTDKEVEALEEYFLMLQEVKKAGESDDS